MGDEGRKKTWRIGQRILVARLEVACITFVCFHSPILSHVVLPNCKEFGKCSLALWLGRKIFVLFTEIVNVAQASLELMGSNDPPDHPSE